MIVADHESPAKCKVESLQNPDDSHGSHYQPNDAAHDSHEDIECVEHVFPSPAVAAQFEFSELSRVRHDDAAVLAANTDEMGTHLSRWAPPNCRRGRQRVVM